MISSPHNSGLACKAYINYIILTPSVTEPLKEEILKGDVHTIEEMKAWLESFGYSDAIKDATINAILREFVMSKVSCDEMRNMDMIVELLRPQLEKANPDDI